MFVRCAVVERKSLAFDGNAGRVRLVSLRMAEGLCIKSAMLVARETLERD